MVQKAGNFITIFQANFPRFRSSLFKTHPLGMNSKYSTEIGIEIENIEYLKSEWEILSMNTNITGSNTMILKPLADLGVRHAGRTPLPTGPNSFVFAYIFTEKCLHQRSMPPQWVHAPLPEILDLLSCIYGAN